MSWFLEFFFREEKEKAGFLIKRILVDLVRIMRGIGEIDVFASIFCLDKV